MYSLLRNGKAIAVLGKTTSLDVSVNLSPLRSLFFLRFVDIWALAKSHTNTSQH
jgi:hypothetical protein